MKNRIALVVMALSVFASLSFGQCSNDPAFCRFLYNNEFPLRDCCMGAPLPDGTTVWIY